VGNEAGRIRVDLFQMLRGGGGQADIVGRPAAFQGIDITVETVEGGHDELHRLAVACKIMAASPVLVLDIDGVVTLDLPPEGQPWDERLQADWGIDPKDMHATFFRDDFPRVLQGRLDLYVALNDYLAPKGLADRLDEFVAYWFKRESRIDRGVLAEVDAWHQRTGGRRFVATNQEHHRVAYLSEQEGLDTHFDEIVYSAALGVCKPDRVFYTSAQARMGVTVAQSILFVDDEPANVDGARMAGWRAMLYRGPESLAAALAQWG
jgi:putative hydrolase of the HAD superfamily